MKKHSTRFYPLAVCAALLLSISAASAQTNTNEPDTLVLSDSLSYDDAAKVSTFTGNVIMTRGAMTLHSDKLVVREDAQGFQYGTATINGNKLVHVRQEDPERFEVIEAKGRRGEYNGKSETIEMIGQATVTRFICGKTFDTISGARVIYKQKSDTYEAYGGKESATTDGRVRSIAQPRAKINAAIEQCRKSSSR